MEKIHASKLLAGLVPAGKLTSDPEVELVTTDSREVKPGCIFVAFPGERFDGHDFAARALEQGAEYVVVNHPVPGVPEENPGTDKKIQYTVTAAAVILLAAGTVFCLYRRRRNRTGQKKKQDK